MAGACLQTARPRAARHEERSAVEKPPSRPTLCRTAEKDAPARLVEFKLAGNTGSITTVEMTSLGALCDAAGSKCARTGTDAEEIQGFERAGDSGAGDFVGGRGRAD